MPGLVRTRALADYCAPHPLQRPPELLSTLDFFLPYGLLISGGLFVAGLGALTLYCFRQSNRPVVRQRALAIALASFFLCFSALVVSPKAVPYQSLLYDLMEQGYIAIAAAAGGVLALYAWATAEK